MLGYVVAGLVVVAALVACAAFVVIAERKASERAIAAERARTDAILAQSEARFRDLAQKVLDEHVRRFGVQGAEAVSRIVEPFAKDVAAFRKRVDEINSEDAERSGELKERLDGLVRQTNAVTKEASNLANAIRADAQVTGQWGEIQLKRVLELGGLKENIDYTYQETFAAEDSSRRNLRTDVIVKMPGNRWVIIDSKTTMAAYIDYEAAPDAQEREALKKRIVESVKAHVDELKRADYQKQIARETGKTLSTVLMYIPFEEVYLIAMKADVTVSGRRLPLRDYARENNIAIVNSSSLMPVLRLVEELWTRENADKKAMKIVEAAESLVAKFKNFLSEFEAVGMQLAKAGESYNIARSRLVEGKGNVMKKLADLRDMGVASAQTLKDADSIKCVPSAQISNSLDGSAQ